MDEMGCGMLLANIVPHDIENEVLVYCGFCQSCDIHHVNIQRKIKWVDVNIIVNKVDEPEPK